MGSFTVLMWKHYTVRKRRIFQTLVEFLLPAILFIVLFFLKKSMQEKVEGASMLKDDVVGLSLDTTRVPSRVIYTPEREVTRQIMDKVGKTLGLVRRETLPHDGQKGYYGLRHPSEGNEFIKTMRPDDAIVEFENINSDCMPDKLRYTIRTNSPMTRRSDFKMREFSEKFEKLEEPFIKLQWAIDSSYVGLKSNTSRSMQNVTLEPLSAKPKKKESYYNPMYLHTLFFLLPYVSFIAPILPFIFLMIRLLEERSTGIQELVKMVGVTPAMIGVTHFLNTLPTIILFSVTGAIMMKLSDKPMLPCTNPMIVFFGLSLHFLSMISMAFAFSYIARNAQYTVPLAMFSYIGMWLPTRIIGQRGKDKNVLILKGLLPHCPSIWFWNELKALEESAKTLDFSNFNDEHFQFPAGGYNGTVLESYIMQLVQMTIFYIATWYLERVRPGRYGIALPWNFIFQGYSEEGLESRTTTKLYVIGECPEPSQSVCTYEKINECGCGKKICKKEYWVKHKIVDESTGETMHSHDPAYQKYFEPPPSNMKIGIKIANVSKIFGSGSKRFQALTNVTLDIYKGEITVLLGHNGAGKTTLMSIITGMINPTSGKIYVNGMDTVTQQSEVRKQLGLCPQHNLFFPDLTVLEHFLFFSKIKGKDVNPEKAAYDLLEQLDLTDKANQRTSNLSGGMLRRLQLGVSLCGDASVLILDEPTSGLDVEARRELWDMLLALRGDRTLVLTTHFMEEADVLGDRLAALHAGRLRCHATPMFLKRAVGSGFRISISTVGEPNEPIITETVRRTAPDAQLKEKSMNSVIYDLPAGTNYPELFNNIENKKAELAVESMGVGITTLEEVFLELCCDVEKDIKVEVEEGGPVEMKYITGCSYTCRQIGQLIKRQFDYTMSKKVPFLLLITHSRHVVDSRVLIPSWERIDTFVCWQSKQIVMPMLLCYFVSKLFNKEIDDGNKLMMDLDVYADRNVKVPVAMFWIANNTSDGRRALNKVMAANPKYVFKNFSDYTSKLRAGMDEISPKYKRENVIGIVLNDTNANIFYNPELRHTASIGVNVLSNFLASQQLKHTGGRTIITEIANDGPLGSSAYFIPKDKANCALFAIFNIFIILASAINDVNLPCKERLTVARHTHIMTGCPPILYWVITFIYHMFFFTVFCITGAMISMAYCDTDDTLNDKDTLSMYLLILVLSAMDFYAFSYWVSYYFSERGASMLLIGLTIVFGFLSPLLIMALDDLKGEGEGEPIFNRIMDVVGIVIPTHVITEAATRMTETSRFNAYCSKNFDKCPGLGYYAEGFDSKFCCEKGSKDKGPYKFFEYTKYAPGTSVIVLIVQFVIFFTTVILLEYGVFNRLWNNIGKMRKATMPPKSYNCPKVMEEKEYVKSKINLPPHEISDTMLVSRATKAYFKVFGQPTFALRDANFSVKKGECFGILGVSGAGKTTTFKLISNEEAATHGTVYIQGHFVNKERTKYLNKLGYCPQFCGLDDFRSGGNNIRMLLMLRGFSKDDVAREMKAWLDVVGMRKYAKRAVAGYSGGMVRRLATAASLCGGSPITLLDEPTAGVDTAARRLVWAALKRGLLHDRAIMLTSHSMDEMEMLCKRITILNQGEMCVLGTPISLRNEFAPGHTIMLKLRANVAQNDSRRVDALKDAVEKAFTCVLNDQHLTSLHYRITEKMLYSIIFTKMEVLEKEFTDVLEDFSVSDTTLEDVFLKFNVEAEEAKRALNGTTRSSSRLLRISHNSNKTVSFTKK